MLDHLVAAPAGLTLPPGEAEVLAATDGTRLRAAFFAPQGPARGTIVLLQGRAEFIEKYGEVIGELLARGFAVATLDWRGQGGSARIVKDAAKGHVEEFADYGLDLDALLAAATRRALPQPWGLLAHSTGCAVALRRLDAGPSPFRRAVLVAPLVDIGLGRWRLAARALSRLLSLLGLAGLYVPGGGARPTNARPFEGNVLTSDRARYDSVLRWYEAEPGLAIGDPTVGWVEAAFEHLEGFTHPGFGQRNRTPLLMVLGGQDRVTAPLAAADLAAHMRSASAITLPGARHEILCEKDSIRAAFWAAFDAFMLPEADPTGTDPA